MKKRKRPQPSLRTQVQRLRRDLAELRASFNSFVLHTRVWMGKR